MGRVQAHPADRRIVKSIEYHRKLYQIINAMDHYTGNITPGKDIIFVFGSNPKGKHGAGSAKVALQKFGAKYGKGDGLHGQSYALITTEMRKGWPRVTLEADY